MKKIQSVSGELTADQLGFTLMHEHVALVDKAMQMNFSSWYNEEEVLRTVVSELRAAKALGVDTIVDATPVNQGRNIGLLQQAAALSGVNILASTGLYWTDEPWLMGWDPHDIARLLFSEIDKGFEGAPGIRPAFIKAGTEKNGITYYNYKVLQTAAILHEMSGLPITTHTAAAEWTGLMQQDVFAGLGVDLTRVIIGHCGDSTDLQYLQRILDRGSTIGMDRFGVGIFLSDDQRIRTVAALCAKGYAPQMVLSHDYCSFIDWAPDRFFQKSMPEWNFTHLTTKIIPELLKQGVSQTDIDMMTRKNPVAILTK